MIFEYEIDELTIQIAEGAFATIGANFSAIATIDADGNITVDRVFIKVGGNAIWNGHKLARDEMGNVMYEPASWVRIDDEPEMKGLSDAVADYAPQFSPELPYSDPYAGCRLLKSELI